MKSKPTDAEIESALREKYAPLLDDGFTLRVMQSLPKVEKLAEPSPETVRFPWAYFLITAAVAIAAFLYAFAPSALPASSRVQSVLSGDLISQTVGRLTASENLSSFAIVALVLAILYVVDSRDTSAE